MTRAVGRLGLRTLALTVAATLLLNASVFVAAGYFGARDVEQARETTLAGTLVMAQTLAAADLMDRLDGDVRSAALRALNSPSLRFWLIDDFAETPSVDNPEPVFVPIIETFRSAFGDRPFSVYARSEPSSPFFWWPNSATIFDDLIIVIRLEDGSGLVAEAGVDLHGRIARAAFVYVVGAVGLVLIGLVAWATLSYATPLSRLIAASTRFSQDLDAAPMPEEGPRPVRELAAALNVMQRRLRALIAERTTILAAVAHDFRTYLTRLRMRAEFIEDADQRARALRDLEDMSRLLDDTLVLGESEARPPARSALALAPFLTDVVERRLETDQSARLTLNLSGADLDQLVLETDEADLKRVLDNLIENALRYAGDAEVRARRATEDGGLSLEVVDHGPGVPEAQLEAILSPFTRLEGSRSRDTGGAGLGLAIAASRATRAGAALKLSNRAKGGLRATLHFPPERVRAP